MVQQKGVKQLHFLLTVGDFLWQYGLRNFVLMIRAKTLEKFIYVKSALNFDPNLLAGVVSGQVWHILRHCFKIVLCWLLVFLTIVFSHPSDCSQLSTFTPLFFLFFLV